MRTYRRISLRDDPERRDILNSLGVEFDTSEPPVSPLLWFNIDECDPAWKQLCKIIPTWNLEDGRAPNDFGIVGTKFSRKDLDTAAFLKIVARHQGYPMPSNDFGYLEETYDLTQYCQTCGVGKRQIAPFRLKGEPEWGKRQVLQLNWVFDEFLVVPEIWKKVFRPLGVDCRSAVDHRTGEQLQTVVQIDIAATTASALKMADSHPSEVCEKCGRRKYLPVTGGPFPRPTEVITESMFKTQEDFGSGASAWKAVIVSSALFQAMTHHRVKGAEFTPCAQLRDAS